MRGILPGFQVVRISRRLEGHDLTWPRRDYLALLEEEEKRRSNRQPLCGCQGPATAAFTPASGRALRGRSTRRATGARQHTARQ
jgi:hypothetical protein